MTESSAPSGRVPRSLWQAIGGSGLGMCILAVLAARWRPQTAVPALSAETEVVVLGSSIAMANIDAPALAEALGRPADAVAQLGARASQPAHWLATLRHSLPASGAHPTALLVVTPLDVLLRERLRTDADTQRLLTLLSRPDPELWRLAVGSDGWAPFWGRQAAGLRSAARRGLGSWLPRMAGYAESLEEARAQASAVPRSVSAHAPWTLDPSAPRPGRSDDQPAQREPVRVELAAWAVVPLLVEEAKAQGMQLWVVAPPVRPADRGPRCARSRLDAAVAAELQALGVTVLDATDAPLASSAFRTRFHLEGSGPSAFSAAVGSAMRGAPPDWMQCPTRGRAGTSR